MTFSYSALLECIICSSFFALLLCLFVRGYGKSYLSAKCILICVIAIGVRCLLPFEFFYTRTLISKSILPTIQCIGELTTPLLNISVIKLIWFIWLCVAIIKFSLICYSQQRYEMLLNALPSSKYTTIMSALLKEKGIHGNIKLVEVPWPMIPSITGFKCPKIVIPNTIKENDLYYILLHELEHYRQHDLYILAGLQFLCVAYWWNPIFYILKKYAMKMLEFRVDNCLTENFSEEQKLDYLQSVLNVLKCSNKSSPYKNLNLCFSENCLGLHQRFECILNGSSKKISISLIAMIGGLFFLSTITVIEPYSIREEDAANTYELPAGSYIIETSQNTYEVYTENNTYVFTLTNIENLTNIPIYKPGDDKSQN